MTTNRCCGIGLLGGQCLSMGLRGRIRKYLLKKLLQRYLPPETVVQRPHEHTSDHRPGELPHLTRHRKRGIGGQGPDGNGPRWASTWMTPDSVFVRTRNPLLSNTLNIGVFPARTSAVNSFT